LTRRSFAYHLLSVSAWPGKNNFYCVNVFTLFLLQDGQELLDILVAFIFSVKLHTAMDQESSCFKQ